MSSQEQNRPLAEDPSDQNQRRRLQELADAQREAREALMLADAGQVGSKIPFAAVKAFAQQIRWLLVKNGGEEFFTSTLGVWEIAPPADLERFNREPGASDIGGMRVLDVDDVEPIRHRIVGLVPHPKNAEEPSWAFVEMPSTLNGSWEASVEPRHKPPQTHEFERDEPVTPPIAITHAAFSACNKFLSDTGLDVRLDETRPTNHMDWEV